MKITSRRSWCRLDHLWDNLFALAESGWRRLRQGRRAPYKKKPSYRPEIEPLERREVFTTVQFSSSTFSFLEYVGTISATVELDAPSTETVTVQFATSNGTALAGSDYTATSGTLTFAPYETSTGIPIDYLDDLLDEENETFTITLSNPSNNASLGSPSTTTMTIEDDDDAPFIGFMSDFSAAESVGNALITVTLSTASGKEVSVHYKTDAGGTATAGSDYTAITDQTLTIPAGQTSGTFPVAVANDSYVEFDETVNLTLLNPTNATLDSLTNATLTITDEDANSSWNGTNNNFHFDAEVSPQSGNLTETVPVFEEQGGCNCGCGGVNTFTYDVNLVYTSSSVAVYPIIQTTFATDPQGTVPTQLQVQLTWNGTPQNAVTFATTGHAAGDVYLLPVQSTAAVTSTGQYSWSVQATATFGGGNLVRTVTGSTTVVVNNGGGNSPFGYGWSLQSLDKLVSTTDGVVWASGSGGGDFYEAGQGGAFTEPDEDFGSLVQNQDDSYTYTAKNQTEKNFDSSGRLTNLVDTHNLRTTFAYDGNGRPSTITLVDGGLVTFHYDGNGLVDTITAPDGRVATLTHDGNSDLTAITRPAGGTISFTYDSNHRMTQRNLGGELTTVAYDSHGLVTEVERGEGQTLTVAAATGQGLGASTALNASAAVGVLTDAQDRAATYTMDSAGRPTKIQAPDGTSQQFSFNSHGQVTQETDSLGRLTSFTYDGAGDQTRVQYADGRTFTFAYDATYHTLTSIIDPLNNRTTFSYDSNNGDLLTEQNALGEVTTYTWSNGLMESQTNPLGQRTTYVYNADRELIALVNPLGERTTFGYDDAGHRITVEDPLGNVTTTVYDGLGRPVAVVDPLGARTTTVYTAAGQVEATVDPLNNRTTFVYDSAGRQTATVNPLGERTTTLYNTGGQVIETVDPLGNTTTFVYDSAGRQIATIDPLGNRTTTVYNSDSQVEATIDALGNTTTYVYDATTKDHVATIDALGNTTTFVYDSNHRQIAVVDALGNRTSTAYNAAGQVEAAINALNQRTTFVYDSLGRQIATVDGLDNRTSTVYNAAGQVEAAINALNLRTTFVYDSAGRQTAVVNPLGERTTTVYNIAGQVEATLDPLNNRTTFIYDAAGRQIATVDALNNRTTTVYNAAGQVEATINALNKRTTFVYDAAGRQIATVDPLNNRTTTVYNAAGQVEATIDAANRRTTFIYDAAGQQTVTIDISGGRTTTAYTAAGQVESITKPTGERTTFIYDAAGRQTEIIDYQGGRTTTVYDAAGQAVATVNPLGKRTTTVYDDAGRTIATVDQLNNRTTFVYDAAGNRTLYQDALNNKTTFVYDSLKREIEGIDPHGQSVTFAYDAAGYMTSATDRLGRRRDFSYDDAGRQTGETWIDDDGSTVVDRITFTYDAVGNQLTAANGAGIYTLTYDDVNRVSSVQEPFGLSLTFTWDALGRRTKVEDSLGGVTTSTYDVLGQLTKREFGGQGQTPLRIDLTYTVEGQQESLTRYSDLAGTTKVATTSFTYDAAQRLTNLHHFDGSNNNIANYTYTYDGHSRLTNINRNGTVTTYTYDDTDQLTADGTNTFNYDAEGNRTNTGYTTGTGNRLTSDGTWNYTYDDEGNMTKKVNISNGLTWTYGYDHRNQLIEAQRRTTDGGTLEAEVDIEYDAYGNRLIKIVDENGDGDVDYRQRYGLDGWNSAKPSPLGTENWDVWADLNGGYNLQTRYLRGDVVDQLFARIKNNGDAFWYLTDHLGSIRDITNDMGVVKDSLTYDGFGNITAETDPSFRGRYAWTGREYDTEIDLQYNRARYYDAKIGRWISQDSLGFEAGDSNLYRYVTNNPAIEKDSSGLSTWVLIGSVEGPKEATYFTFWECGWLRPLIYEPRIEFRQARGHWYDIGAGVWGQPGRTAKGEGRLNLTPPVFGVNYGSARSFVEVWGDGNPGGHCNTIIANIGESNAGGDLRTDFVYFRPGKYKVELQYHYRLKQDKNGSIRATATVYLSDETGELKPIENKSTNSNNFDVGSAWTSTITVIVGSDGKGKVARIIPNIAGGKKGRAEAFLQISIKNIEMVENAN